MEAKDIRFSTIFCSGSETGYEKNALEKKMTPNYGWRSKKFCTYPQEIVIQFEKPTHLLSLSLLSHEYLIARKVEVELKILNPEESIEAKSTFALNPSQANFTKLGYVEFSNNEATNYECREQKTLQLDYYCTHAKFIIWHPHNNPRNLFAQVSLIKITATGSHVIKKPPVNDDEFEVVRPGADLEDRRQFGGNPDSVDLLVAKSQPGAAQGSSVGSKGAGVGNSQPDERSTNGSTSQGAQPGAVPGARQYPFEAKLKEISERIDPEVKNRLKVLDEARKLAEESEDYREAKILLEAFHNLVTVASQLVSLEDRKSIAVREYDYDSAQLIKLEIENIKNALFPKKVREELEEVYGNPNKQGSQMDNSRNYSAQNRSVMTQGGPSISEQYGSRTKLRTVGSNALKGPGESMPQSTGNLPNRPSSFQPRIASGKSNPNEASQYQDSQPDEDIIDDQTKGFFQNGSEVGSRIQSASIADQMSVRYMSGQNQDSDYYPRASSPKRNFDDVVIPTLDKNKARQVIPEYVDGPREDVERNIGNEYLQAEDVEYNKMGLARQLSPSLSKNIVKALFSKNWNFREQAINAIRLQLNPEKNSQILNFADEADLLTSIFGAVSITIYDKLPQIVQSSVVLLDKALKELNPPAKALDNQLFRSYCEEVGVGLILCFGGENKPLARDLAEQILLQMTSLSFIGSMFVANLMYKPTGLPKSKAGDPRLLVGRLSLLTAIARQGVPDKDYQPVPTVDLAARNLESPSYEVRNAANDLIFEVYKKLGSRKIEPMLMGVRDNLLVPLFRKFSEYDLVGGENGSGAGNVLERFGDARVKSAKSKAGGQPAELGGVKSCMYCLRTDRNFLEMKKYHMHLSRECPMLTVCRSCAHVVEISQMHEHLSSACEVTARAYEHCKECDEYYAKGEYDEHQKKGTHIIKEEGMTGNSQHPDRKYFCPLCHKDLGQVGNGGLGWVWRKHLIMDGCPKNDRTF